MASLNKVFLIGNVGRDPDIKILESGLKITKFPLATHDTFKSKDGKKIEQTEWHNVVILRSGLSEIAELYLKKGKQIFVEGRLRTRIRDDKEGNKKIITEVVADNFIMLGKRKNEQGDDSTIDNDVHDIIGQPPTFDDNTDFHVEPETPRENI